MIELKMPDINTVLIAGNLTCDPSFRKTTNGTPVANFYIASNRKFKDNTGQWRENVCYVGVVAWYKLAESCYENLKRGSAIIVDGELQSRSWRNNDGTSRNVVEIKARRIQFLNRKPPQEGAFRSDEIGFAEDDTVDDAGIFEHENFNDPYPQKIDSTEEIPTHAEEEKHAKEGEQNSDNDLEKYTFGYDNLQF
jgi:single-strand DNA-binding protein